MWVGVQQEIGGGRGESEETIEKETDIKTAHSTTEEKET